MPTSSARCRKAARRSPRSVDGLLRTICRCRPKNKILYRFPIKTRPTPSFTQMSAALSIVTEVETALHGASGEKRSEVLRRITDLFVASADNTNEHQTALFDGVMGQLIIHVE